MPIPPRGVLFNELRVGVNKVTRNKSSRSLWSWVSPSDADARFVSWTFPISVVVPVQVSGSVTSSGTLAVVSFAGDGFPSSLAVVSSSGDGSPSFSPDAKRLDSVEFGGSPGSDGTSRGP